MKKLFLSILAFQTINIFSQDIAGVSVNPETVPDNNLKHIYLINPNFNSSFAVITSAGVTKFAQTRELRIIDTKTLTEKKKVEFPKYNGYDILDDYEHSALGAKQNVVVFYQKKDEKNSAITNVYGIKIDESLTVPQAPTLLYSAEDPQRYNKNADWHHFYLNDNKDLGLFAYVTENKKKDFKNFYYRLFDNNLKLLKTDSVTGGYKTADTCHALVYDNGAVLIRNKGTKCDVTILNIKTNKSIKITLNGKEKTLYLGKVKTLANGKLILCGNYTSEIKGKLNGIFKITYNPTKQAIEEEVYNDHTPSGKFEMNHKIIRNIFITESGNCYVTFFQVSRQDDGGIMTDERKYEVMGISSVGEKWQKQIAILDNLVKRITFALIKENLFALYPDGEGKKNETINYNNYEYGHPYPTEINLQGQISNSLLKIMPNGTVTHQFAKDIYASKPGINIGNDIISVQTDDTNSKNTFKAAFVKYSVK